MATGRFAPSPTGTLHLGNLRTALAAWLFARSSGGMLLLRFEDLDRTASADHEAAQKGDLARLGIEFDGEAVRQSDRLGLYRDALSDLDRAGLTYPCWCSRREIREAVLAPHQAAGTYPGTCRSLSVAERRAKEASGRPPALRLRAAATSREIVDRLHGPRREVVDDFVLRRGDGTPAFHLTVVVDDAEQGVEEVVRGDDLLQSTPRHAHLQSVLGLPEPQWAHVPLVVGPGGDRLAKRDGSDSLDEWLDRGGTIGGLVAAFGRSLGIPTASDVEPDGLLPGFEPTMIPLDPSPAPSP